MADSNKRTHSPSGGGNPKKFKGPAGRGGFFPPGPPGWGMPPPPGPPPFPFGFFPPPDDFDFDMYGGHRDDWYPSAPPPPPPPPPGQPAKPEKEDFADDDFAIYGSGSSFSTSPSSGSGRGTGRGEGRGRGPGGFRGGGGMNRGRSRPSRFDNPNPMNQFHGRGTGPQGRGGPPNRGNRGGPAQGGPDRGGAAGARGRGRGLAQRGMPPNMFDWKLAKARKDAKKAAKQGGGETVPPVHSLAKVSLDVSNMSVAEKIHRFSLYVRNDQMKENAIQHLMNAQTGSKLMLKIDYEAEELAKVGSKHMYTGRITLEGVFLARAVCVNKKELKHLVFQKALNVLLTKTVAEIYNLVDPGVDTLREELEREEAAENKKKDTRSRDWMGQDIGEAFQIIIDKLKNNTPTVDSDISRIEQAITAVQCVIRHQYVMDAVKHKNGRITYKGALEINNIIIGRGVASSKKTCKRLTYGSAMENLMAKTSEELLIPVPEVEEEEDDEGEEERLIQVSRVKKNPKPGKGVNVSTMSKKEKFSELLKSLKAMPFKESNINPIDVTAMQFGIVPMAVYRKLDTKKDEEDCLCCELYLDNIFITSAEGRKRAPTQKEAYNKGWELLTTTDVDTLLSQHAVISSEELKAKDVADIIIKGGGKTTESNLAALRRVRRDEQRENEKMYKKDIVVVEHADWSNDRMRNSFAILQCSCTQNGMLLKWTLEGNNSRYLCEVFIEDEKVGGAYGPTKQNARALAMTDALYNLYATQDTVRISRRDDSKTWIPWQSVMDKAEKLKKNSPPEEEPEEKTDEKGFFLADKYLIEVMTKILDRFAKETGFEEVIFGPGMPATESREIRTKARELKLTVDIRQHLGEAYLIFYKKLNYPDLVKLLKKRKRPYGKYELVPRGDLPKHEEIKSLLEKEESKTDKKENGEEMMSE